MNEEGEKVLEKLGEIADAADRLLQDRDRHTHSLDTTLKLLNGKKEEFRQLLEAQYPMFQVVARRKFAGRVVLAED